MVVLSKCNNALLWPNLAVEGSSAPNSLPSSQTTTMMMMMKTLRTEMVSKK